LARLLDADFQGATPTEPQPMSVGADPALVSHGAGLGFRVLGVGH
jgi:hypothetical protein